MRFRWTIEGLKKSDNYILRGLVAERLSELMMGSPLHKRLQNIYDHLDEEVRLEEEEEQDEKDCREAKGESPCEKCESSSRSTASRN